MKKKIKQKARVFPVIVNIYRCSNYILNFFYRKENVAMFHIGRCGSSLLAKMLKQHRKILWAGEIFEKFQNNSQSIKLVKQHLYHKSNMRVSSIFGFETKYLSFLQMNKECILDNLEEYINFLRSKNYQKFITLHRSNYLRWAVSVKIGKKTGIWHSNKNTTKATQINLNLNSFTKDKTLYETMQYIDNEFNRLQNILKDDEVLLLYYEKDILNNPYQAYKKVCNFLEIKPDNPKIELKPTNPYPLKALISNYNEVKDYLTNTKYEWMLED